MGIRDWWEKRKVREETARQSVAINEDEQAIAAMAPELSGMGFVKGGAYVFKAIEEFQASCTEEQATELAGRLIASQESWKADGLTMPYWGTLVVLRRLQADIANDSAGKS